MNFEISGWFQLCSSKWEVGSYHTYLHPFYLHNLNNTTDRHTVLSTTCMVGVQIFHRSQYSFTWPTVAHAPEKNNTLLPWSKHGSFKIAPYQDWNICYPFGVVSNYTEIQWFLLWWCSQFAMAINRSINHRQVWKFETRPDGKKMRFVQKLYSELPKSTKNQLWWTVVLPCGNLSHSYWSHAHWNNEFSHSTWWIFPYLCKRLPEARSFNES